MADDARRLTIGEAADRCGRHRATIRRAIDAGRFPSATRDAGPSGAWRIPVDELDAVYPPPPTPPPAASPADGGDRQPDTVGHALQLLDGVGPLLDRVSTAERERQEAEVRARIAEHHVGRLRRGVYVWPAAAAAAGLAVGAAIGVVAG